MSAIANLWAQRIISDDKAYADVPAKLKKEVADILKNSGHEDLITE